MHGQSFTGMLSQTTPMPIPMPVTHIPSQSSQPNINEPRDNAQSSPEQWEDEVPETQPDAAEPTPSPPPPPPPSTSKGKRKGKGKAKEVSDPNDPNRMPPKIWTPNEEIELAKAWVTTSEDSVVGNNRSKVDFWGTVKSRWEQRMGCPPNYRTVHQIRSKAITMGKFVTKFSNIYNNVRSARKSGEGDGDWLGKARFRYQEEMLMPFKHEHVWEVIKGCEKYLRQPLVSSTPRPKRSKTSESATPTDTSSTHGPFDVDDEDEYEDHDEEEEERPRPMGRNAARSLSGSTGAASTDRVSGLVSELSTLNYQNRELLDQRQKDFDLREKDLMFRVAEADEKRERRDYKFYVSPHGHLSGGALLTTLDIKEKLRQKYGWHPLDLNSGSTVDELGSFGHLTHFSILMASIDLDVKSLHRGILAFVAVVVWATV
ncbi:hypothetical protein OSB04_009891 [Centaurea solstitialis]|uniref:No apical meristem-associated C-terminal domain-containing protein n=1 Tax=Centaurea solstitialis TaxID=347529 RepID=A0AA38WBD0_9ASTR|nr:hypothetical protein OSB04_009891 [Centaurea solstitialis]